MKSVAALLVAALFTSASAGYVAVPPNGPFPDKTEPGQYGTNNCGTFDSPTAKCQTLRINTLNDFCLWAPKSKMVVGAAERDVVSWCTKPGHGSRLIPKGALTGVHMLRTPHYVQITGTGDFTKMNIPSGDDGGELDPHGADGLGNPIGGIVIANINRQNIQIKEWTQFISDNEFCIRACLPGKDAARYCEHIYDTMGCYWNLPGSYAKGSFDTCKANDVAMPMGEYKLANGQNSTWYQGVKPTPAAQRPAASSKCAKVTSVAGFAYPTKKATVARVTKRHVGAEHA